MNSYITMDVRTILVITCLVLVSAIGFSSGFEMNDLVKELPGQPKVGFRQFAGYVPVGTDNKRSMFYYFIEAETEPDKKPLTVWLSGGPGCAGEAFEGGIGPFFPSANARKLEKNSYAWNKVSNLLFVDNPVGAGWSSSSDPNDYYRGDRNTTDDLLSFMQHWYEKYPSFNSRALYVAGSSYGGHFAPNLAVALLNYKVKSPKGLNFNLKGVALGNPLLRNKVEMIMQFGLVLSHGMIKQEDYDRVVLNECKYKDDQTDYATITNNPTCYGLIRNMTEAAYRFNNGTIMSNYDTLRLKCDKMKALRELKEGKDVSYVQHGVEMCMHEKIEVYLNQTEVMKALHADRNPFTEKNFEGCFRKQLHYSREDYNIDMLPALKQILLQQGINMIVFSGDADGRIPANATRKILDGLAKDLNLPVKPEQPFSVDNKVGGTEVMYGDKLTYIVVNGGNHHVTSSAPAAALQIFSTLVSKNA